jgi:8-oxo-dGTP diphosphatase
VAVVDAKTNFLDSSFSLKMPATDQGVTRHRYTLIPRTLIFLTRDDRILLLKGASHKRLWADRYNGVGGHIERGEDVLSAARRELFEETRLNACELWLCGVVTVDTGQEIGIGIYILRGECPSGEPVSSHEGTPEWVSVSEVLSLPLVEDLYTLIPLILAQTPDSPPFSAHYSYDADGKMVISFG